MSAIASQPISASKLRKSCHCRHDSASSVIYLGSKSSLFFLCRHRNDLAMSSCVLSYSWTCYTCHQQVSGRLDSCATMVHVSLLPCPAGPTGGQIALYSSTCPRHLRVASNPAGSAAPFCAVSGGCASCGSVVGEVSAATAPATEIVGAHDPQPTILLAR